ncbi:MAG: hypothetical protein WHU94_12155 [Thermogemmata sp.]|uniref:Uncharacterized protein n=1 Tax=Thermogemmata fonticola TaxID=2755323 RepID=A0A7V8VE50_9BACT|nr:hypothetical protein [Thermogemmata fonticola]MBA2226379.1 hypothetical protein [Thermogemmata fonticola]MCX8139229.1 hypothetical protein [Gemmataceae bacterium]
MVGSPKCGCWDRPLHFKHHNPRLRLLQSGSGVRRLPLQHVYRIIAGTA